MQSDSFSIEPRDSSKSEVDLWVEKFRPKDYFELLSDDVYELIISRNKIFLPIK